MFSFVLNYALCSEHRPNSVLDLPYQRALCDMPDIETTLAAWAQGTIAHTKGPWQEFAHCHGPLLV